MRVYDISYHVRDAQCLMPTENPALPEEGRGVISCLLVVRSRFFYPVFGGLFWVLNGLGPQLYGPWKHRVWY